MPASACDRASAVDLPLHWVEGFPLVRGRIAGRAVSLLLDTGAQGMLITPGIAEALRLPVQGVTRIYGTGGSQESPVVLATGLRLAGRAMPDQLAPVAMFPVKLQAEPPFAGLVGASVLARFDLDLNVPAGRIGLWPPGCAPQVQGMSVPLRVTPTGEAYVPVRVNGAPLAALLDTGSRATLLGQAAARRLGVRAPVSANTARGIDGERLPLEHTRVMLGLGEEPARGTPVSVTPLELDRGDMLLGLDVLGRRRVWVGYQRGELIFAGR